MKKLASILVLILVPFTNVSAKRINGNQLSTPRLCGKLIQTMQIILCFLIPFNLNFYRCLIGAMDESSEEKCDNQNTILSNRPTLKAEPFKVKYLLYKNPE